MFRVKHLGAPDRTHKNCTRCGLLLPLHKFDKDPEMADGHKNQCAKCRRKRVREARQ